MKPDEVWACEVARDMIELGRDVDAKALVEVQAPNRHAERCVACGAAKGQACRDLKVVKCRFCDGTGARVGYDLRTKTNSVGRCTDCHGTGQREQLEPMIAPHESRLIGIKDRMSRLDDEMSRIDEELSR